ncbi:AraC family transcriptional regulator [Pseudomonas aeruginosa]|nr:AraC family transcriptional regulator [Pseudomonas aeruginosa]
MEQITHLSSGIPGVRLIDAEHNRFSFPRHFHLEYHIGLLLQGRHRYAAGGERRLAGAGDALLMAPESIHDGSSAGEEGYRIRVLALDADWLESRLEYPPNLEELAAFCGLSPWQVLRRFRRRCGLPPHQWLTQLRLERALPLVLRGEQPLSQVAQQFGFYDQAHFSRLFRRTYGLPPARLRQR